MIDLEMSRRVLGEDHPRTLSIMRQSACILAYLDHWDEAESLMGAAIEISRRTLGAEDAFTADLVDDLSRMRRDALQLEQQGILGRLWHWLRGRFGG